MKERRHLEGGSAIVASVIDCLDVQEGEVALPPDECICDRSSLQQHQQHPSMHRPGSKKIMLTSVRLLSRQPCADTATEKGWRGHLYREVGAIVPRGTGAGKQAHAQRGAEAGNDLGGGDHCAVQPMPLLKGRYCYPVPPMSERHISCTMAMITVSGCILALQTTCAVCMVSNCCNGCCRNVPIPH